MYLINPIDIQINCVEEKWSRFLNVNGFNKFRNISMQKTQHQQCMNSFAFIMHDKYAETCRAMEFNEYAILNVWLSILNMPF